MRLAFSSRICANWDLAALIEAAQRHGYAGLELPATPRSPGGSANAGLLDNPESVHRQLQVAGIEPVSLAVNGGLDLGDREELSRLISACRQSIALAGKLGCTTVRIYASGVGNYQGGLLSRERREDVFTRVSDAVRALVEQAVKHRVTVLVENGGRFADSLSIWSIVEAAGSPLVKCCWNPSAAREAGERSTTAIPRLGSKIGLVRIFAAELPQTADTAVSSRYDQAPDDVSRMIQLLKGIDYQGYLLVDGPRAPEQPQPGFQTSAAGAPTAPDDALSAAAAYLRKLLDEKPVALSAYKGDKFRPRQGHEFRGGH